MCDECLQDIGKPVDDLAAGKPMNRVIAEFAEKYQLTLDEAEEDVRKMVRIQAGADRIKQNPENYLNLSPSERAEMISNLGATPKKSGCLSGLAGLLLVAGGLVSVGLVVSAAIN